MLWVVTKSDERTGRCLSSVEEAAVRAAAGGGGAGDEAAALEVLREVREHDHWLACDCRAEADRRPLVAPCRLPERAGYTWRVLAGEHRIAHAQACVFFRLERERREQAAWSRAARLAPRGFFSVLVKLSEGERLGRAGGHRAGEPPARRVPALSRLLLELMRSAGLSRIEADGCDIGIARALGALKAAAHQYSVAPARPLAPLFFISRKDWNRGQVHAVVHAAAEDWPHGHRPQAFLCCFVRDVTPRELPATKAHRVVPVDGGLDRPSIGQTPVGKPYLFIGAVGLVSGVEGECCRCIRGYAQPVVSPDCPVPVDSHYERQAFGTLRTTLDVLKRWFADTAFVLEKPVFETPTALGPCLPDFLLRARRGEREAVFVIEVMGFERPSYLQGKEVTHPRMAELGTLLTMHAGAFAESGGVIAEGRRVTQAIAGQLRATWR